MPNPTLFKIFVPMLKTSMGSDGKRRLHGVASSTVRDRHGDTMTLSALSDMETSARQNMTIFLNHSYNVPEDVAGTVENAFIRSSMQDPDIHDLSLDIVINEKNDRAVKAWEAIDDGTKLGLSIGAMIPDGGAKRDRKGAYEIDHIELLETSLVGVPANPRSWVEYAVKALSTGEPNGTMTYSAGVVTDLESDWSEELCPKCNTGRKRRKDTDCDSDFHVDDEVEKEMQFPEVPEGDVPEFGEDDTSTSGEDAEVETDAPSEVPEGIEPDITDATVTIETPLANITVDTGRGKPAATGPSQEAPPSEPEHEDEEEAETLANPWAAIGLEGEVEVTKLLEPAVIASLSNSKDLLKAITRELIDTKAALKVAEDDRDVAIQMAEQAIKGTARILDQLSATPVGRRAVVKEASDQFASLSAVYGPEFVALLKKG